MSPPDTRRPAPLLGAAVVLAAAALAWWWIGADGSGSDGSAPAGPPPRAPAAVELPADLRAAADTPELPASNPGDVAARGDVQPLVRSMPADAAVVVPPAVRGPTGGLRVQMVWAADGSPAAGIGVRVAGYDTPERWDEWPAGTTDARGVWTCDEAPAGAVLLYHARGDGLRAVVRPGSVTELSVALPPGIQVSGSVTDADGEPVVGATVRLGDGDSALSLFDAASTDEDGAYALRDVREALWVDAVAPGHAPSWRFGVEDEDGRCVIDLALETLGGALEGTVTDPGGRPVAGAEVAFGVPTNSLRSRTSSWLDQGVRLRRVRSDEGGSFRLEDLPVGTQSLMARAEGVGRFDGDATIEGGRTTTLPIRLAPAAVLRGIVTDQRGRPVPGASVWGPVGAPETARVFATSAHDGSYALEGLPARELEVVAYGPQRNGDEVRKQLVIEEGLDVVWDPVFELGRRLDGRVVTADGRPAGRWSLTLCNVQPPEPFRVEVRTDSEGRFTLAACPGGALMAEVYDWTAEEGSMPVAVVHDVVAAGDELVVRLPAELVPSAYVRARLAATGTSPEGTLRLGLVRADQHVALSRAAPMRHDDATGADLFGPLVPGDYRLLFLEARGMGGVRDALPVPDLRAFEVRDLGVLTPPEPGRIVVRVVREGAESGAPRFSLVTAGAGAAGIWPHPEWTRDGDTWTAAVGAGAYRLHVLAPDIAPRGHALTVTAGRDTEVLVETGPIVRADITFELPADGPDPPHVDASVRDAAGATVWEGGTEGTVPEWKAGGKPMAIDDGTPSFPPGEDPAGRPRRRVLSWLFAPGTYTVSARFEGGPPEERAFTVPDDPAATVRVDLRLR